MFHGWISCGWWMMCGSAERGPQGVIHGVHDLVPMDLPELLVGVVCPKAAALAV